MPRLTREALLLELERRSGRRIALVLTTNACSYVSFTLARDPVKLRLQRLFLDAPDEVLAALGRWLAGRERRCPPEVREFIDAPPPHVQRVIRTKRRWLHRSGRCHDLGRIFDEVNRCFFHGRVTARLTWGRSASRRNVGARTLGAYYFGDHIITINPVLDQEQVPAWFVAFTVYHECLHSFQSGRGRPHDRKFQVDLRRHPDYAKAARWEKANIRLLTRRPDYERATWRVRLGRFLADQLKFPW
jgi:predicted SprT family Zn-dependent metalloprotease